MDRLVYALFPTDLGWIGILGSKAGLRRFVLPQPSAKEVLHRLVKNPTEALNDDMQYLSLWNRIRNYFSGQVVDFSREVLDLPQVSPFQKAVWGKVRAIPHGEARSYKWVAEKVGRPGGSRAVGQALSANPLPIIIPCHRVVGVKGLGGYAGGLPLKKKLLEIEASGPQAMTQSPKPCM